MMIQNADQSECSFLYILFSLNNTSRKLSMQRLTFMNLTLILLCLKLCSSTISALPTERWHTNQFAVYIPSGDAVASQVAERQGFINKGQIGSLKNYYLFEHHNIQKRSLEYSHYHHARLKEDKNVLWVEQQHVKQRIKRDGYSEPLSVFHRSIPDPLYPDQWYLHGGGRGGHDMNVVPVWRKGYTGKGIVVSILDDGIQTDHPDLIQNYDPKASADINSQDSDPTPQDNGDNKHGTRCAGEVAATAYNEFCGIGIAFNASIGGVRMLDGTVTDEVEARALSLNPDHIDIYSASWGPEDDGKTVDGPGTLAKQAFVDGITSGRNGKGSIFVWASGNGGRYSDNCNCDGYTNSIYTLSISSATQGGSKPWYLEECSSTLATTYSSGTPGKDRSIVTVDMDTSYLEKLKANKPADPSTLCTKSHTGTSASAPIAAAICALALEANPSLTWRDMQHLVVMSSKPGPLLRENGWVRNAVGRRVSPKFGYGLMDAAAMVKLAEEWTTVPEQHICELEADRVEKIIPNKPGGRLEASLNSNACENLPDAVHYLEHVQVRVTLQFMPRGNLHIILVSPSGTPSSVLLPRPHDTVDGTLNNWPLLSVHFWGEPGKGKWQLIIINEGSHNAVLPGKLVEWNVILYGTERDPVHLRAPKKTVDRSPHGYGFKPINDNSFQEEEYEMENECARERKFQALEVIDKCVDECPRGQYGNKQNYVCNQCHDLCEECYGSLSSQCLSCEKPTYLMNSQCVIQCPAGYYGDSENQECLPCLSNCASCFGKPDNCLSCKQGFFLYRERCIATCPSNMFPSHKKLRCKKCPKNCETCTGNQDDECLTCIPGYYFINGFCNASCPVGFYNDYNKCERCDFSCKSCLKKRSCSECNEGWEMNENELCQFDKRNCAKGQYADEAECRSCHFSCKSCSGPNKDQCTSCDNSRYFHQGTCVESCPLGYYGEDNNCMPCHESCSKCKGIKLDQCQKCKKGLFFLSGTCNVECPAGMYANGEGICSLCNSECRSCIGPTNTNCTACNPEYQLTSGRCVNGPCPDGYYRRDSVVVECLKCHQLCKTCTDAGPTSCISCFNNATITENTCIPCLDNEYFDIHNLQCQKCYPDCESCSGPTENDCLSCSSPYRIDREQHKCFLCCKENGVKESKGGKCCICDRDSVSCITSGDHPRSINTVKFDTVDTNDIVIPMKHVVPVVVAICFSAVLLFLVLFGILQATSNGWWRCPDKIKDYERVPNPLTANFDADMEKVALTHEDADEEEDIYQKA